MATWGWLYCTVCTYCATKPRSSFLCSMINLGLKFSFAFFKELHYKIVVVFCSKSWLTLLSRIYMQVLFSSHGREDQGSNRLHADYMEVIIQIAYACYLLSLLFWLMWTLWRLFPWRIYVICLLCIKPSLLSWETCVKW